MIAKSQFILTKLVFISFLFCSVITQATSKQLSSEQRMVQQGQALFQDGAFEQAIEQWKTALKHQSEASAQIDIFIRLATAYQALGDYTTAHKTLEMQAMPLAKRSNAVTQQILINSHLSDLLLAQQQPEKALLFLQQAEHLAETVDAPRIEAHLHNNMGNVWSVQQTYAADDQVVIHAYSTALAAYQKAAQFAQRGHDPLLQIQALSNQIQLHLKARQKVEQLKARLGIHAEPQELRTLDENVQKNLAQSARLFASMRNLLQQLPEGYDKNFHLLGLGQLILRFYESLDTEAERSEQLLKAYQLFQQALQRAEQQQDHYLMAYATGLIGAVYEQKQRYPEALQLTRKALFLAQEEPSLLSRWKLQRSRILHKQVTASCQTTTSPCADKKESLVAAIDAYRQARDHLHPIQTQLFVGQRNSQEIFYQHIRPVHFGLADVLLQQVALTDSPAEKAILLKEVIESIELLKESELQEYFQNECLLKKSKTSFKQQWLTQGLPKNTAVLYPILLVDRTELLLSLPNDVIYQATLPLKFDTLSQTVRQFRNNLQDITSNRFIKQAKQLYEWLITPLKETLLAQQINTLIIVPDGGLRTVPLAALFDKVNKQFLVQEFALATIPSFNLTAPHPLPRQNLQVLLNGLSEGVQEFSALPNVQKEIQDIQALFQNNQVLLNSEFTLTNVSKVLLSEKSYSIVHIASHGQFRRDPKDTFLLVYDAKLTINKLEELIKFNQLHKLPVELLTLSACQTAVGDERAALGLAGVAIKAGARSALASLWYVKDEATSQLMTTFYQRLLKNPELSKAQALQEAQKNLFAQRNFRHPAHWAPFLLIGNWL
jgi:CHAT domain-containing protein